MTGVMLEDRQTSIGLIVPFNRELRWRWLDIRNVLALLTFDGDANLRISREQPEIDTAAASALHLFRVGHHDAFLRVFRFFGAGAS